MVARETQRNRAPAYADWRAALRHTGRGFLRGTREARLVSMLYLPFNDPDATYAFVKEFGEKKGVVGFLITSTR